MSNLEELIERLCPDGVEYKSLEKCCEILDKKRKPVAKSARISGEYPYYGANGVQDYVSDYIFDGEFVLVGEDGSVITDKGTPVVTWASGKIWVNNHAHIISEINGVLLRYIYYYLQTVDVTIFIHGNIPKLTGKDFKSIQLPVPPLEVQREIVRILDNFTFLTTELAAELAARQKQYEYYRDLLLTFKPNESTILNERTNELELSGTIRWMKLGDTCVLKAGKAISATEISQNVNDDYIYPCYGGNGLRGYVKNYNQDGEHPIVGRQGALCGNVCYACNKFYATEHAVVVSPSALYNEKFLYYLLDFARLEQYKTAGAQPGLSVARLEKVVLPVPPLEVQQRIVDILDRFDTLCNDISSGLPAEIEARQKQYEYYRDKLLTFKELKKEA